MHAGIHAPAAPTTIALRKTEHNSETGVATYEVIGASSAAPPFDPAEFQRTARAQERAAQLIERFRAQGATRVEVCADQIAVEWPEPPTDVATIKAAAEAIGDLAKKFKPAPPSAPQPPAA